MITDEARIPSRRQKVGWRILLLVGVLMVGNGVMWIFVGPSRSGVRHLGHADCAYRHRARLHAQRRVGL